MAKLRLEGSTNSENVEKGSNPLTEKTENGKINRVGKHNCSYKIRGQPGQSREESKEEERSLRME